MKNRITRFRKGNKVEVFHSTEALPTGRWVPAEILSGNGHNYYIKYNQCPSSSPFSVSPVQRVPRKAIRPCPPVPQKPTKWAPQDSAEVFVHGSWKLASVTGIAFGNNYYFVKLIGSSNSREFAVQKSNIRPRQQWENGKWVVIRDLKDSGSKKGTKRKSTNNNTLKGVAKRQRLAGDLSEKVDAVVNPNVNPNHRDTESTVSSVGSCSTSYNTYPYFTYCEDDVVSSSEPREREEREEREEGEVRETHSLELRAYTKTMEAMHASGPISWEQETLLSNLRLMLNISLDEHQSVLRGLVPNKFQSR